MITVEEAIMTRLKADSTLQTLLGGSGRIFHAMEPRQPTVGCLTYHSVTSVPSKADSDSVSARTEAYQFSAYHQQYENVLDRVHRLLHHYRFPTPSDAGIKSCVWEWDGPDEFDEDLKVGVKRARYVIEVARSAQAPI